MRFTLLIGWLMIVGMMGGVFVGSVRGQLVEDESKSDQAIAHIQGMGQYLKSVKAFRMEMTSVFVLKAEKQPVDSKGTYAVACRRPHDLAVVAQDGDAFNSVYSTQQSLVVVLPGKQEYTKLPATAVTELADSSIMRLGGPEAVLAQLLSDSPVMRLLEGASGVELVDRQEVDGVLCHRIKVTGPSHFWYLWIEAGNRPLPRQITYDLTDRYRQGLAGQDEIESAVATLTMQGWEVDGPLDDQAFAFTPGETMVEVDNPTAPPDPMKLLDKPVPDYTLELLDGGVIDPAADKGKVVLIDFWASYCPPCIAALPVLQKLTGEYADKDVSIYAINVGEPGDHVRQVLASLKVKLNVAVDNADNISGRFKVYGLPQTVIVDRQGIVRKVIVGGAMNPEQHLRMEIEAVRAMP